MAEWDLIECGFNAADETINFGTRVIGDCENLFETCTLATIKHSQDTISCDKITINSVVKDGKVYFSINKVFKVFKTLECNEVAFELAFDEIVDCFCVLEDVKLLFVCLRNGFVYGFSISEDAKLLFVRPAVENNVLKEVYFNGCYSEIKGNSVKLWLVTTVGSLYSMSLPDILLTIKRELKSEESPEIDTECELVTHFDHFVTYSGFNHPYLFVSGEKVTVYDIETQDAVTDELSLKKIFFMDDKLLIGLQQNGVLVNICSETLIHFEIKPEIHFYKDIVAYNDRNHILAVTQSTEMETSKIQLISCFGFNVIFSLNLANDIFLITPENINDDIIYITEITQNDTPKELRFTCVYETSPEARLMKLLKKNRLEEAEAFVNVFNLDLALIWKARAQAIVDKSICSMEDIDGLLKLLDEIKDSRFTLQCCMDVYSCCERLEDVKKVLQYGCRDLPPEIENDIDICAKYSIVSDYLFRFDIYVALLNDSGKVYDPNTWFDFSRCNLIKEVKVALLTRNFKESVIMYSRLDTTTDLYEIHDLLETLDDLPIMNLEPFLHVFIPVSLKHQPSLFPVFVKWLYKKILQINEHYPQDFPENAIAFANTVSKLLEVENEYSTLREIDDLTIITKGLKQLQILKEVFKIEMSLQSYLEGPKNFIGELFNVSIDLGESYGDFLQNYVYKYILDNNLVPDDIFLEEIINLMQYEEKYWISSVPQILKCINTIEVKLKAILAIMNAAQVPWAETLSHIFNESLNYNHPLVSEIKNKIESYPVLSVLRKYRCLKNVDLNFLVGKIIYENRPTMLEDIKKLCRTPKDMEKGNVLLILHFLEIGDLEQAIKILTDSPKEVQIHLCRHFVFFISDVIGDKLVSAEFQENCYEFLRPIFNHLNSLLDPSNPSLMSFPDNYENIIRNTYIINKTFRKNIKASYLKRYRNAIKDELIDDVVHQFQEGTLDFTQFLDLVTKISKFLNFDRNDLLVDICAKIEDFTLIHKTAERIYQTPTNSKSLCLIAILLLKHVGSSVQDVNFSISDLSKTLVPSCSTLDLKVIKDSYLLARRITAQAILKADKYDLDACCLVLRWVEATQFMLSNDTGDIKKYIYKGLFSSDVVVPSYNTFNSVKNVFNVYVDYIRNYYNPNTKYLTYFNHDSPILSEDQLQQKIKFLPRTVADLATQGQPLTAFKLIVNLRSSLVYAENLDPTCLEDLNNIIVNKCVPQLLQHVLSTRHFDADLAYDLLMNMDVKKVVKYIQQWLVVCKVDIVKFEAVARLAYKILERYKDHSKQEKIKNIILTCNWWKKLRPDCPMRYEDFFKSAIHELAEKLLQFNCLKENLLEEFCIDFQLDLQTLLIMQLKSTLLYWKPNYTVETDATGKKKLIIANSEKELLQDCTKIIEKIENKHKLLEAVNGLWSQINFYYYEVFNTLLQLLEIHSKNAENENKRLLLLFLKNYNRISKPNEAEKGEWFTAFPDTQSLDPVSEFRLPFTITFFTSKVWNLIRSEISLQTYKYWFEAVDILKGNLSKDEICCFAAKQVTNILSVENNNKQWLMYPKHVELFNEIDRCVQQINDLTMATATVYHLLAYTPEGADLVQAATLCYKYALKYKQKYPDDTDVHKNFIKVEKIYLSYSAMHILHLNMLSEERYLKLVSDPNALIDALYDDERIIKKFTSVVLNFPDINKTVEDLAELYQIDIHQKRITLLNHWLANSTETDLYTTTIQFFPNHNATLTSSGDVDNVKRAAYLCSGKDIKSWRIYLSKRGLSDTHPDCKHYAYRAKALMCFSMITDPSEIFEITGTLKSELMNFITKLSLLSDLEYQGYNYTVESLDAENKKEILNRLSQNINCPLNVKVMGALCMAYNICCIKYWKVIIKYANRLNLLNELKQYIEYVKPLAYFKHTQFYIEAWQRIIDTRVSACVTTENYVKALHSIQCCPVLYSLKLDHLVEMFINKEKPECAAILLQYLAEDEKKYFGEMIVSQHKNVLQRLEDLDKYGVWGINQVKNHLLEFIL